MAYLRDITAGTEWEGQVFVVGGSVRDEIMGLPIKDIDMVVSRPDGGIRFAQWLYDHGLVKGKVVKYEAFGTAMLHLLAFPDDELEFVQTRKEKYPDRSSRNPVTAYGSIEEDIYRRDLTINSLVIRVSTGKLIDVTGHGVDDIRDHIIRTPADPDITYDDDPLRILRCVRFASRYGWDVEKETLAGMMRNVSRLGIITRERVRDELDKMLLCDRPVMAMELLRRTGAMAHVIPELGKTYDMGQNAYHFGTVWEHTMAVLDKIPGGNLTLRLAALLHDIGKIRTRTVGTDGRVHFIGHEQTGAEMAASILRELKYPSDTIKEVAFLIRYHMATKQWGDDLSRMKDKSLRKLQYECGTAGRFADLVALIDADNRSHAPEFVLGRQGERLLERSRMMEEDGTAMFAYSLPLSGRDIMEIKGLKPGPAVRECQEYLMKLAFVRPLRTYEEWTRQLQGYRLK